MMYRYPCIGCGLSFSDFEIMDWQMCGEDFTRNNDHTLICPACQDKLWQMGQGERLRTLIKWRYMK